jgi:hypothetical protein
MDIDDPPVHAERTAQPEEPVSNEYTVRCDHKRSLTKHQSPRDVEVDKCYDQNVGHSPDSLALPDDPMEVDGPEY